jgi:hypothetical protein
MGHTSLSVLLILGKKNINPINRNSETRLDAKKKVGLEVNTEKIR